MEGPLSMPPDRGTIIGRAVWKVRWVVVGGSVRDQTSQTVPANRVQSNRASAPRELTKVLSEGIFLSIYKSKEDTEPIQQYAVTSIADCQLQMLSHRKQGPAVPTLVLNILPDPQSDKARKRRSSRTAGFTAPKEMGPTSLLFRPGDESQNLQEWARFIQQLIQPYVLDRGPMSPLTPASPTFVNPFAPRPKDPTEIQQRPNSRNGYPRPGFLLKNHSQTNSVRDRPATFSDSPSLRSKRSDLSSQTGSTTQSHMGFPSYTAMVPADLPSPATTIGEYQGEFIEGWTSAQGRSSALSSPIRGRGSVSSQPPAPLPSVPDSKTLPGPRETILDRAFQLRCIPGSDREIPGGEKLSSLARFDALMREMDEKRRQREAEEAQSRAQAAVAPSARTSGSEPKSAFDQDDSDSDSEQDSDDDDDDDDDDDSDSIVREDDFDDRFPSTSTQRALDFIAGRYEPTRRHQLASRGIRSPPSYNHEAFMALSSPGHTQVRPQTGYSRTRNRPGMAQRTHSQPHLATMLASSPLDQPRESEEGAGFSFTPGSPSAVRRSSVDKRQSGSSAKRLSFTDFTRRLSSTSSLLLMQTNASGPASSRASNSDMDLQQAPQSPPQQLHHLHPRSGPPTSQQYQPPQSPPPVGEHERCGWRGSVGVFGDGGFV
ncbi:hypothetical protein C7999DRAFT_38253 [Corynascus novoguineensis]|uniref:Uncharacterized protein n=1 Tax=Corynascus novoguineensis TaxID=1126955 RepID=A0AAN7D106_9PEZI|nr:hypothetical protein C7999DRAFT_38253 [Corynascus novoguineensis]